MIQSIQDQLFEVALSNLQELRSLAFEDIPLQERLYQTFTDEQIQLFEEWQRFVVERNCQQLQLLYKQGFRDGFSLSQELK